MNILQKYFPHFLLVTYVTFLIIFSFQNKTINFLSLESVLPVILILILFISYIKGVRLSNTAYLFMAILPLIQICELAEVDFLKNIMDPLEHFSIGLYSYGLVEYLVQYKNYTKNFHAYVVSVIFVLGIASSYEIIEWVSSSMTGMGDDGLVLSEEQIDMWDAQKDIIIEFVGTLFASVSYFVKSKLSA